MLKVMLEAVSDMLKLEDVKPEELAVALIQVSCAKTILDKVIEGLKDDKSVSPVYMDGELKHPPVVHPVAEEEKPVPPKELPGPVDGKYKIVKDDNNKLVRIEGLPLDAKVELDGKTMTHQEAKGKKFISGRIL